MASLGERSTLPWSIYLCFVMTVCRFSVPHPNPLDIFFKIVVNQPTSKEIKYFAKCHKKEKVAGSKYRIHKKKRIMIDELKVRATKTDI